MTAETVPWRERVGDCFPIISRRQAALAGAALAGVLLMADDCSCDSDSSGPTGGDSARIQHGSPRLFGGPTQGGRSGEHWGGGKISRDVAPVLGVAGTVATNVDLDLSRFNVVVPIAE